MSERTYDRVIAEYDELEQQVDELLQEADPEGTDRQYALTRRLRKVLKVNRGALAKVREEERTAARAEMAQERKVEAAWRTAGVPEPVRPLFDGLDPLDSKALLERKAELQSRGIAWNVQPAPPPVDPNQVALAAMQQASAGALGTPEPWDSKMKRMAKDPGAFSDQERDEVIGQFNAAVRASERPTSGAQG